MPLTTYQKRVALSPFHYPLKDLYVVMEIIARPEERQAFGEETMGVIFNMHKAAVSRRLNAPANFRELMGEVDKNISSYTKSY